MRIGVVHRPHQTREKDRAEVDSALTAAGVGVSVHYIPLHRMPYWRKRYDLRDQDFPQAEARYARTLSLPLYPALTLDQVDAVCDRLISVVGGS